MKAANNKKREYYLNKVVHCKNFYKLIFHGIKIVFFFEVAKVNAFPAIYIACLPFVGVWTGGWEKMHEFLKMMYMDDVMMLPFYEEHPRYV